MDNYYNSPELGEMLLKSKTDVFGTLRPNRKDLPKELKIEKLTKLDLLAYKRALKALRGTVRSDALIMTNINICEYAGSGFHILHHLNISIDQTRSHISPLLVLGLIHVHDEMALSHDFQRAAFPI
ncbi:hypothetical protein TNIN_400421 [Trichonephila inaurata madagascariensis]|uniref:PiggyBac transposable element-derived protein domain-containing protein n=1 Tax=Trichonephila inaurata madagascariensis TaxID=2747483 RepID=A0A8X6YBV7_9ARAC|nr:hypothetical protein TNIN_400421 [Trichonephila inaurata madagascariensis]